MTTIASAARAERYDLASPRLARASAPRGRRLRLAERRPERVTMVVFFRGLHCPVCRAQLAELDGRLKSSQHEHRCHRDRRR